MDYNEREGGWSLIWILFFRRSIGIQNETSEIVLELVIAGAMG